MSKAVRVGSQAFYVRLTSHGVERLTPNTETLRSHPWPVGATAQVELTVFEQDRKLFIGQVEVTTQPVPFWTPWGDIPGPEVAPMSVDSALWRSLPLGELKREAIATMATKDSYLEARNTLKEDALRRLDQAAQNLEPRQPRRGPRSSYTPDVLKVAAKAFLTGGHRGVVAAREALADSGLLGPLVTHEQAKKAVAKAREAGLIPPARRG